MCIKLSSVDECRSRPPCRLSGSQACPEQGSLAVQSSHLGERGKFYLIVLSHKWHLRLVKNLQEPISLYRGSSVSMLTDN